jgi:hypothetical protein
MSFLIGRRCIWLTDFGEEGPGTSLAYGRMRTGRMPGKC